MLNNFLHILITYCLIVFVSQTLVAQDILQVHSGGTFYNTGEIGVFGDVVHQGDLHCGDFAFYGRTWTNSPTATIVVVGSGPGFVSFEQPNPLYGSFGIQNLDGNGNTPKFHRIVINNPNNVQLINTDTYAARGLGFLSGHLVLNNQDLTLGNTAVIFGATAARHVKTNAVITSTKGFLIREGVGATDVIFPVGNSSYNPVIINNSGTVDDIKARVNDEVLADGTLGLPYATDRVDRTWHVEEGTAGGSNVSMTLQWDETEELPSFTRGDCSIKHYTSGIWDNPATSPATNVTGTTWSQTRTGISNFSPFGVRDPDVGILPVELVYFGVELQEDCSGALVNWTTASEENVASFELEHSLDGIQFITIGEEAPTNTLKHHNYYHNFLDLNLSGNAANYFRLKSIDNDGSFSYSNVIHINASPCLTGGKNKYDYSIYPSPNSIGELYIRLPQGFEENKEGMFVVTDVLGRVVLQQTQNLRKGKRIFSLNIENLVTGTYFIQHKNSQEENLSTQKFVVVRP